LKTCSRNRQARTRLLVKEHALVGKPSNTGDRIRFPNLMEQKMCTLQQQAVKERE
jgi:cobalamin biosynthesis protein CbiD